MRNPGCSVIFKIYIDTADTSAWSAAHILQFTFKFWTRENILVVRIQRAHLKCQQWAVRALAWFPSDFHNKTRVFLENSSLFLHFNIKLCWQRTFVMMINSSIAIISCGADFTLGGDHDNAGNRWRDCNYTSWRRRLSTICWHYLYWIILHFTQ